MKRLTCFAAALAMMVSSVVNAADVNEHQWVRASANGSVMGRVVVPRSEGISAARGAKVSLIDQYGKYATKPTESDKTGRFTLTNVPTGVYTLMIQGENAFACCAMHVVDSTVPIDNEFEIAAGAMDASVVRGVLVRYTPSGSPTQVSFDPSMNPTGKGRAVTGEAVRVQQFEGGLRGRLTRAGFADELGAKNSNVLVYSEGVEVARALTDENGDFVIADLAPGSYSVLGSGADGFGLMGIELVDPGTIAIASVPSGSAETLVSQVQQEIPNTFVMQVAPLPPGSTIISDELISEEEIGPAIPLDGSAPLVADGGFVGGGPVSGGAGGGGALGGGGGLRGVALLGGIGAAIAIGLADDDDSVVTPPVVSPSLPANN